jgi:hypothetical protein
MTSGLFEGAETFVAWLGNAVPTLSTTLMGKKIASFIT